MSGYENVESPASYDFWCAVWLVSNAVSRTITVARPYAPVYLNVYCILCAEAGITRKSSAVRYATSMLTSYIDRYSPPMGLLSGSTSSESLTDTLASLSTKWGISHVALSSSELVTLLGRERYAAGLPGKLTDLYDCPDIHTRQTIAEGSTVAKNVYVTMLGASTPSWLVHAINPNIIEGGFTSRCLFIIEDKPKRLIAWPTGDVDEGHTESLVDRLHSLRNEAEYVSRRAGGIHLTRVARQQFTDWYERRTLSSDTYGSSFQAREDHHILRLSGIMAASDGSWEIDEHHITHATSAIQHVKQSGVALFGSGVAASKTYALVDRIRGALVSAGRSGLSQSALTGLCRRHGTKEEQSLVLSVMHEMELIQKFLVETGDRGRPITMYRGTRALASSKVLEDVVDLIVPQEA